MKQPAKHLTPLAYLAFFVMTLAVAAMAWPVAAFGDPPPVSGLTCLAQPDAGQWYHNSSPSLIWRGMLATPSIAGYSFVLDHSLTRVPDTTIDRPALAFAPPLDSASVATAGIVAADLNGDGKLDLVVNRTASASVYIQFGRGDGRFGPPHGFRVPKGIDGLVVADVNGDGKPDLVMTTTEPIYANQPTLVVMLGKGNGAFGRPWLYPIVAPGNQLAGIVVTDLNGDRRPDIVFGVDTFGQDERVVVLLNRGGGRFSLAHNYKVTSGATVSTLAVGDVNGDGKPDLVVGSREASNQAYGYLSVLMGRGDGSFKAVVTRRTDILVAFSLAFSDVNGDGRRELVVGSYAALSDWVEGGQDYATIALWRGHANGTLSKLRETTIPPLAGTFAIADYNADGRPDVGMGASGLIVLLGNGDGTFQAPVTFMVNRPGGAATVVADFNGDGRPDFALAPGPTPVASVSLNRSATAVYHHLADGVWYFHVRAIDSNGAGGPTATRAVRIDTHRPVTRAPTPAVVKSGGIAHLGYMVTDPSPSAGWCTVKIEVRNARNRTLLSRTFGHVHSGVAYAAAFRCTLAKGVYRFYVFASDAAGNPQHNVAFNQLIVN